MAGCKIPFPCLGKVDGRKILFSQTHTHTVTTKQQGCTARGVEVLAEGEGGKNTDNTNC